MRSVLLAAAAVLAAAVAASPSPNGDTVVPLARPAWSISVPTALPAVPGTLAAPHGPWRTAEVIREPLRTGSQLSEGQMLAVLDAAGWPPEAWPEAASVAWCESRWRPGAVRDTSRSLGLFQLWTGWFPWAGEPIESWHDPVVNARTALRLWETDGWRQWTCQP